jgi:hypothetical protein
MNDDKQSVNWRSVAQNLVSTHKLYERESKIIVSKLLLEKSEFKTRFEENLNKTLEYEGKIHDLEMNISLMLENNKSSQKQEESVHDRIKDLETENSQLRRESNKLSQTLAEKDDLSLILRNITQFVDVYRQKLNFKADQSINQDLTKEVLVISH